MGRNHERSELHETGRLVDVRRRSLSGGQQVGTSVSGGFVGTS